MVSIVTYRSELLKASGKDGLSVASDLIVFAIELSAVLDQLTNVVQEAFAILVSMSQDTLSNGLQIERVLDQFVVRWIHSGVDWREKESGLQVTSMQR